MVIPTAEQLRAAQEAIRIEGPMAPATLQLGLLCIREPLIREVVRNMILGGVEFNDFSGGQQEGMLLGAVMAGLNLGLRIPQLDPKAGGRLPIAGGKDS
jgi:hypothetical protein